MEWRGPGGAEGGRNGHSLMIVELVRSTRLIMLGGAVAQYVDGRRSAALVTK